MKLQTENTVEAAKEKHVPVIEKVSGGVKVKVGSVAHPMEEKHSIEWIEIIADGKTYRQFLKPGDKRLSRLRLKRFGQESTAIFMDFGVDDKLYAGNLIQSDEESRKK